MFDVTLYTLSKERNSCKRPSGAGETIPCTANMGIDVASPLLPFAGFDTPPLQYNYAYIPVLQRYYWIERWTFDAGMWVANCTEDVLATWRSEIGDTTAYILRCSADSDGYIVDTLYPATGDAKILSSSATVFQKDQSCYVMGLVCAGGATEYVVLTPGQYTDACAYLFSDDFFNTVEAGMAGTSLIRAQFDPMQYIKSCMWFPFSLQGGRETTLKVGWWDTGIACREVAIGYDHEIDITISVPKHPQAGSRGAYLNLSPYSQYTLDIRPWGRIVLPPEILTGNGLNLHISVDPVSGVGILSTLDGTIKTSMTIGVVGVQKQLSQVSKDYLGGVTSILGGVASAMFGNFVGAAASVGNAVSSIMGQVSTTGIDSGMSQLFEPAQLTGIFLPVVDEDNDRRGRPLCAVRQISSIPGYIVCADPAPDFVAPQWELDAVRSAMQNGFYFE